MKIVNFKTDASRSSDVRRFPGRKRLARRRGFSLIELLMVMAIMGLLVGSGVMSFSSMQSQSFTKQVYDLKDLLAAAKTSAMAKNTFVWVGFGSAPVEGRTTLVVTTFFSRNGQNDATGSNLAPLYKAYNFPNFTLAKLDQMVGAQTQTGTDLYSSVSNWQLPTQKLGGAPVRAAQAILFSPNGQCFLATDTLSYVDIGVKPTRGTQANDDNLAALQVSGLTSQVQLFRK